MFSKNSTKNPKLCTRCFSKSYLFVKNGAETAVNVMAVVNGEANYSSNELEVGQVLGIDARIGTNLEGVNVLVCVFEETVLGVEHRMGQEIEPLASHSAVIHPFLARKLKTN